MRTMQDLERIDRATLRLWRMANLAGWWLVGAVVYHTIAIVLARTFVQKVAFATVGYQNAAALILVFAFAAVTAGAIVGSRVYRSPFVVGALVVLVPDGLFLLFTLVDGIGFLEIARIALFVLGPALVAGLTARIVWRRRPRALHAT